jgi:hypothetical protein
MQSSASSNRCRNDALREGAKENEPITNFDTVAAVHRRRLDVGDAGLLKARQRHKQQHRLLDLHDAPVGAFRRTGEVSDLRHDACAGDEDCCERCPG